MLRKRRLWQILFGICCVFFLTLSFADYKMAEASGIQTEKEATAESDQMIMKITYGYDKCVKYGRNMGVWVEITNNGNDFDGKLCILVPNNEKKSMRYSKDITILAGKTKKIEMAIPVTFVNNKIEFSLEKFSGENGKKNEILKKTVKITVESNTDTMYAGILSDDAKALDYLSDEKLKTVLLNADSFPKDAKLLDMLDMIVINNFNTKNMTDDQYLALKQFAKNGGTLVIGMGSKINKDISEIILDDEKAVPEQNKKELLQKKNVGLGNICLFDFDLGLDSKFFNTKGTEISTLMKNNITEYKKRQIDMEYNGNSMDNSYALKNSLNIVNNDEIPKVGKYAIILGIYLLLVGPPLYFILKKLDKRNYLWVYIPAFAILFSFIIFVLGAETRIKEPIMNYVTISEISDGLSKEEVHFKLMAPFNKTYGIDIPKEYSVTSDFSGEWYAPEYQLKDDYNIEINTATEKNRVIMKNCASFESANFKASGIKKEEGSLACNIAFKNFKYQGTITNKSPYNIKNGAALLGHKIYRLGDIKAGMTVSLSECKEYDFNTEAVYEEKTIEELAGGQPYNNSNEQVKRTFYAMQYYLMRQSGKNNSLVFGFVEQPENSLVNDLKIKKEGIQIVTYPVEVNYQNNKEKIIPDITPYYETLDGNYDANNILSEPVTLKVSFHSNDKLTGLYYNKELNSELNKHHKPYQGFYGEVLLFNFVEKKYEKVFAGGIEGSVKKLNSYIDKDNTMRIQLKPDLKTHQDIQITIPVLSVTKEAN